MALFRYDDLPTDAAKAKARSVWVESYTVPELVIDGFTLWTPVVWDEEAIADKIREDVQGFGFLFNDDGTLGV